MSDTSFRAGYCAVIGRPNVGKSTLVNALIGERLAPTSPVPQTTRRRLLGILTRDDAQVVFVDTPGIHQARQRLGAMMNEAAEHALLDADVVLVTVDSSREPGEEDETVLCRAARHEAPRFLVVNKIDAPESSHLHDGAAARHGLDGCFRVSALRGDGLPELLEAVIARLPESPPYFPEDQLSDAFEREIGAELIREAVLRSVGQEVPHAVAVKIDQWQVRPNGVTYISANLFVERDSQKGIVIGQGGRMLKRIGMLARVKLEEQLAGRVFLELQVRVLRNWRKDDTALRRLGFYDQR